MSTIICNKCDGHGYTWHYSECEAWTEFCEDCNGDGVLKNSDDIVLKNNDDIVVDDIATIINEEMVYITKKEYEELLEYKHKYEDLCS